MSIFSSKKAKRTALEAATETFGKAYGGYSKSERAAVVSLIAEIFRQTKHPAFGKLAADMGSLAIKVGPMLTTGKAMPYLILAISEHAPELGNDLERALGHGVFAAEVKAALEAVR